MDPLHQVLLRRGDDVIVEGANFHVRSGAGTTASTNGLGNLIVGYNEGGGARTGSHNIVLGRDLGFSSYAGLVTGELNSVDLPFTFSLSSVGAARIRGGTLLDLFGGVVRLGGTGGRPAARLGDPVVSGAIATGSPSVLIE